MSDQNIPQISQLLSQSKLSATSQGIIINNLSGNQAGLLGATGTRVEDLNEDDVTLVAYVLDESSSMHDYRIDVIEGFNVNLVQALRDSKLDDSVIMTLWKFSSSPSLVYNYRPLANVVDIDSSTYVPSGSTALYDAVLDAMSGMMTYSQQLRTQGLTCRGILSVISDGENNNSHHSASEVRKVAEDMLREEIFNLIFYAFGPQGASEAANMGFPTVMKTGQTGSEFRRAMGTHSKSIIRTSQTKVTTSGSGFFNP